MSKRWLGIGGVAVVVAATAGLLLGTATWSPLARLSIQTAANSDLAPGELGILLYRPAPWSRPAISEGVAVAVARRNVPNLQVQQTVLAWMVTTNLEPNLRLLAWVVVFKPSGDFVGSGGPPAMAASAQG